MVLESALGRDCCKKKGGQIFHQNVLARLPQHL